MTLTIILAGATLVAVTAGALVWFSHQQKTYPRDVKLINKIATVSDMLAPEGSVIVNGELWPARSFDGVTIPSRAQVRVVGFQNLFVLVKTCG